MKRTVKNNIITERFYSFGEFVNTTNSRENTNWAKRVDNIRDKSPRDFDKWYGGIKSLKEAQDKLLDGDDTYTKKIMDQLEDKNLKTVPRTRVKNYNDVVGFAPIVPNAIMGIPQSMLNQKRVVRKSKVIKVCYDVNVSANVSEKSKIEQGIKLVNYLKNLERQGYRIRLNLLASFADEDDKFQHWHICKIRIKSESQPFDLKRLAWAMINPAMLRVLCFNWYETLPESTEVWKYGTPLYHWLNSKRQEILKNVMEDNEVYISFNDYDFDECFERVKK